MPRYDKYDPVSGGFRVPLAAARAITGIIGAGLDVNGRCLPGAPGVSGYVGVLSLTKAKDAGDIVDVMTDGEMVEMTGLAAGTTYYIGAAGALTATAPAAGVNGFKVGHTVEATRLVVRFQAVQG